MTARAISIGIAAYNERDIVVRTVEEILRALEGTDIDAEILIIDDASTDGTAAFCQQAERTSPLVRSYRNEVNLGFGGVYLKGAVLATKEWYLMLSGDNSLDWRNIRRLLDLVGHADMVIPCITNPEIRSLGRQTLSWMFTGIMNWISGRRLRYYNGPVIHRTEDIRSIQHLTASFAFHAEIVCRLLDRGASVVEVGVAIQEQGGRESSALRFKNIVGVGRTLVRLAFRKTPPVPPLRPAPHTTLREEVAVGGEHSP